MPICPDYLEWLRWPHGFECARCDGIGGWRTGDRRIMCAACGHWILGDGLHDLRQKTRTPLTVWFTACWSFATAKDGISALSLQRSLEIGSYQTAWAMLARFRSVLVHPGRKRLNGTVEVDETYIGGEEPGLAGGRAQGKKVLTGIAVEVREPKGIGRCRMALLEDGSAASLLPFVSDHVAPAATVITDAWMGYHGLAKLGYAHRRRSQRAARARGEDPAALLPAPRRFAGQAVAAEHSPGGGRARPPAELPRRVCVPLQPPALAQPRHGLLPCARACGRSRAGALPQHHCREQATEDLTSAACYARASAEPGPSHRRASVARCVSAILRLNGEPEICLCRGPDYADAVSGSPGQRAGRCPGIGITRRGSLAVCLSGVVSVSSRRENEHGDRRGRLLRAGATVSGRRLCWRSSARGWSGSGVCQGRRSAVTATR